MKLLAFLKRTFSTINARAKAPTVSKTGSFKLEPVSPLSRTELYGCTCQEYRKYPTITQTYTGSNYVSIGRQCNKM